MTIVFADIADSTVLGERLDPEALRAVMTEYFETMRGALEHHGGTVEKFIGDAVMAVFGVPVAHADDALRAVRAADEMQERLSQLNRELKRRYGIQLGMRIGVNTGEVVAGDPAAGQAVVTGDAVNLAKRLEQAAPTGEILIGKATYPLVKDAIKAGPLQSFSVKGKREPVTPFRLEAIDRLAAGIARPLDRPLVGRESELAALEVAFSRARASECRLFTILGPPGIGKSRLAAEFVTRIEENATVLSGRCLPYGDGIALWPLREIVRALGGRSGVVSAVDGDADADLIVKGVLAGVGETEPAAASAGAETAWAFRRLFENLARERPLVLVLEDIHWAAQTLLDLIEYLHGWSRAPILIVCLARMELVERHASWVAPRLDADSLVLEALTDEEAEALLAALPSDGANASDVRRRVAEAAEGNPLFLEQMAAMLAEEGTLAARAVPPSIQALLAERLDQLAREERAAIERAAVIGREFWAGAVLDLTAEEADSTVAAALMALVRKRLIRPDASAFEREDAFRFQHVLIRDAAYEGIPKRLRAELHERFAAWLEARTPERRIEVDEIIGYHLEQAHGYLRELGTPDTAHIAAAAAARLGSAGRRAFTRGDMPAAADLLSRASALATPNERVELAPELGRALLEAGDVSGAADVLETGAADARGIGNRRLEARAEVGRLLLYTRTGIRARADEVEQTAQAAVKVFEDNGDEIGLAHAWRRLSDVHWMASRWAAREAALERALEHARRAGDPQEEADILGSLGLTLYWGPTPVAEAIARCRELLTTAPRDRVLRARIQAVVAPMAAMQGDFDEARDYYAESKTLVSDLGLKLLLGIHTLAGGMIELLAGDPVAAEKELRSGFELLRKIGATRSLATIAPVLAQAVYVQGRLSEAEELTRASEEAAAVDDITSQVLWLAVRGKVAAVEGRPDAEKLARAAVELAAPTDSHNLTGDAFLSLAEVALALGESEAAADAAQRALQLYEAKGNIVSLEVARAFADNASRLTAPPKRR